MTFFIMSLHTEVSKYWMKMNVHKVLFPLMNAILLNFQQLFQIIKIIFH